MKNGVIIHINMFSVRSFIEAKGYIYSTETTIAKEIPIIAPNAILSFRISIF